VYGLQRKAGHKHDLRQTLPKSSLASVAVTARLEASLFNKNGQTMSTPQDDAPIPHFEQCHVGILTQLERMGQLPALLAPAQLARHIAQQSLAFFDSGMYTHHSEEEEELFPAVRASAQTGPERLRVEELISQLTHEHRGLEKTWKQLEPALRKVAKGQDTELDTALLQDLVARYQAHAQLEEQQFLPLAETILGRSDHRMAALGMSLHMRHVPRFVMHI
jgi:hypothetical protein